MNLHIGVGVRALLFAAGIAGCRRAYQAVTPPPIAPAIVAEGRLLPFQGSDSADQNTALAYGRFAIQLTIHGQSLLVMADHGANGSLLTDAAIDRLRLPHWYTGSTRIDTLVRHAGAERQRDSTPEVAFTRGDTVFRYWGVPDPRPLDSLRLGASLQESVLLAFEISAASIAPFDGIIGRDILSQFDLLFDLPAGTLRLYERSPAPASGHPPTWLPSGLTRGDCIAGHVRHDTFDTTGFSEDETRELLANPLKRLWEQREIQLPVVVNGRPIDAMFDSGAGATSMNWAEARALGIARASRTVFPYMAGGSRLMTINAQPTRGAADSSANGYADSTFVVAGLAFHVGSARLSADSAFISDPDFADDRNFATDPMLVVGLRQMRDHRLFLSYSTGFLCLSRAARTAQSSRRSLDPR